MFMNNMVLEISFWQALEGFLFLLTVAKKSYAVKKFFWAILMKGIDLKISFWKA